MLSERFEKYEQSEPTKTHWSFNIGKFARVSFCTITLSHKKALQEEAEKARETLQEIERLRDTYADDYIWEGSRDRCEQLLQTGAVHIRTKMIRGHIGTWRFWLT